MRSGLLFVSVLAVASLVGSPVLARAKQAAQPKVSCKEIKDAVAGGKTADEVAKDLKVSASRVKSCTAPPATHHRKHTS